MQYSPPSFFKQGPPALVRLAFFVFLSLVMLVVDTRMRALDALREAVSVVLYPFQRVMLLPRDGVRYVADFFEVNSSVQQEIELMRRQRIEMAQSTAQAAQLASENAQLRRLLGASERVPAPAVLVQVLYESRDAFSRRLIIDKGSHYGIIAGMPVIDDGGVVGQVVRTSPMTSEVALLTDRVQSIPIQVLRNGLRGITSGGEIPGRLGLRFMASDADIQVGDTLVTSGLDGIYPEGLPVATVESVERDASSGFARILCKPVAGVDRYRHFLVLQTIKPQELPGAPGDESSKSELSDKSSPSSMAPRATPSR
ncbi:rod shape-determining protein MreC [Pigmentiphaga sp. GD03639]|jgi:rod shape-determining protein MreC|uniref:Cell shape-determining protein MreC n=1 Tax=Pigmentiphaga daeguensis TaxID=414049 RepID=A0ABN1C9H0_9BURK|nr:MULTISPECIES: rod shape-determining protein MreC [unclassified Pigmentiphaga]MDH2237472.1 rod shape-determining protein MreC [Pigmentiphaga sp. GD03639]OVZ63085.1 rod shape-determining protein MreC [Pigmentiphaga sp. NML030171]